MERSANKWHDTGTIDKMMDCEWNLGTLTEWGYTSPSHQKAIGDQSEATPQTKYMQDGTCPQQIPVILSFYDMYSYYET